MEIRLKSDLAIKDFLNIIEKATGLNICLYDFKDFSKRDEKLRLNDAAFLHSRPYCLAVKSSNRALKKCVESDHSKRFELIKKGKPVWRTCHAGLSEIVIPVFIKGKYICTVLAGQVFLKKPSEKEIDSKVSYLEKLGVNRKLALRSIKIVPVISKKNTKQSLSLISMLVNFIVETGEKLEWREELNKIKVQYHKTDLPEVSNKLEFLIKSVKQIRNTRYKNIVNKVLANLSDKPVEKINLAEAAKEAGLSRFYLSRIFKTATGRSFRDHVVMFRIEKAKKHMVDVNLNLSEIAYKCGYQDLSSFTRSFKKSTGTNPGKFRLMNMRQ